MKWIPRFVVFVASFLIGIAAAPVVDSRPCGEIVDEVSLPVPIAVEAHPLQAEDLPGLWKGTWGYNRAQCTIKIDRVDGEKFYGTLTKGEAKITLEGTFDVRLRTVHFREIKVIAYGEYSGWSLGTNDGSFSSDGHVLMGTGTDAYGTYGWEAAK